MNRIGKLGGVLLGAMTFAAITAVNAEAAPLRAWLCTTADCSGAGSIAAIDNVVNDADPTEGVIAIVPGVEIATSYPATGSPSSPYLNLTYTLSGLGSGGTRYLYGTQDEFTYVGGLNFLANASSGSGSATVYTATGLFPSTPGPAGDIPAGCGSLAYTTTSDASCTFLSPTPEYYLAIGLAVTANASGAASGDATIAAEPVTIALFGMGLLGAGIASRRRRQ